MPKRDFKNTHRILDGEISIISALNNYALISDESEVHIHHDHLEIYYFLDGDLYFSFEGRQLPIEPGSIVIIDCDTFHRPIIKSNHRYFRKRILINKKVFHRFNTVEYDLYPILHKKQIIILNAKTVTENGCNILFEEIENSITKNKPADNFCALVNIFSLLLKAEKNSTNKEFSCVKSADCKISEILEYINLNLSADLSYKALSKKFFISEKNLYKIFKQETGFTLSDYIKERRIVKAISLLNSGINASKAAEKTGFTDYSVFYRAFVKKVGMTPTKYIKNR